MHLNFETERVRVRPIGLGDASFMLKLVNTEGWLKFIGDRNIHDVITSECYIQKILDNSRYFYHVFELKDQQQPLGVITFLFRANYDYPDIGFAILPEFEGQGFTYEAAKAYLDVIIEAGDTERIGGITLPENKRSIHLLKKLGLEYSSSFELDGEPIDLYEKVLKA